MGQHSADKMPTISILVLDIYIMEMKLLFVLTTNIKLRNGNLLKIFHEPNIGHSGGSCKVTLAKKLLAHQHETHMGVSEEKSSSCMVTLAKNQHRTHMGMCKGIKRRALGRCQNLYIILQTVVTPWQGYVLLS